MFWDGSDAEAAVSLEGVLEAMPAAPVAPWQVLFRAPAIDRRSA
jgi:hypothetical protein